MSKFNIGDKVVVVKEESVRGDYKNGDIGHVCQIDGFGHGYVTLLDGRRINVYWDELEFFKESSEVISTAWKIGDVEFILESDKTLIITGNGDISIDIDVLKKIVQTLDNR